MANGSLGSGQVESDVDKPIIHFGSPPDHANPNSNPKPPRPEPTGDQPTSNPVPQPAPQEPKNPNRKSFWKWWVQ